MRVLFYRDARSINKVKTLFFQPSFLLPTYYSTSIILCVCVFYISIKWLRLPIKVLIFPNRNNWKRHGRLQRVFEGTVLKLSDSFLYSPRCCKKKYEFLAILNTFFVPSTIWWEILTKIEVTDFYIYWSTIRFHDHGLPMNFVVVCVCSSRYGSGSESLARVTPWQPAVHLQLCIFENLSFEFRNMGRPILQIYYLWIKCFQSIAHWAKVGTHMTLLTGRRSGNIKKMLSNPLPLRDHHPLWTERFMANEMHKSKRSRHKINLRKFPSRWRIIFVIGSFFFFTSRGWGS